MVGSRGVEKVRFGPYEADFRSGELRKLGIRIKLQGQPFKLLALLIDHAGDIVTREELQREIWGPNTVVDFDHSLRTAINKLREALCDSAESPRYIETLARLGYRFVAEVQPITLRAPAARPDIFTAAPSEPIPPALLSRAAEPRKWRRWSWLLWVSIAIACGLAVRLAPSRIQPDAIVQFSQVTWSEHVYPGDPALERFPIVVTDGLNVLFPEMRDRNLVLASAPIGDGNARPLSMPAEIVRPSVADISPDGTRLLVLSMNWVEPEHQLWIVPSHGGAARKVSNIVAHDATWLPGGESILFASGHDLFVSRPDDAKPKKLAGLPGRAFWLRYSPDGSLIRFTIRDSRTGAGTLWEMSADGKRLQPLLSGGRQSTSDCCGSWTSDGSYVFQSSTANGMSNIWIRREISHRFWPRSVILRQLTAGPLSYLSPVPERRGNRVFIIGSHARSQLVRFDPASRQFYPIDPRINNAARVEFSRDKTRVAWVSGIDGTLWQSLVDGSQWLQLTSSGMRVFQMHWSPDGRKLAFVAQRPGEPSRIHLVAADGSNPEVLLNEARGQTDPSWSPDGNSIVFGRLPDYAAADTIPKAIHVIDLKTRMTTPLPGSDGLFSPRWSPNGRYIVAMPLNQRRLMIFELATRTWRELASRGINNPSWSVHGDSVYFQSPDEEDQPIYKVSISRRREERVVDFRTLRQADKVDYLGLTPDDGPILSLRFATADIYSLTQN
ncbi:MAG: winged helix-turn-helix domain-containing protein [Bryobacteraceae bacterium]|jgi:Tol biopolymer transport system component/DNA-binding winged helix-turn-helix (wHTH) protein